VSDFIPIDDKGRFDLIFCRYNLKQFNIDLLQNQIAEEYVEYLAEGNPENAEVVTMM
jgi:hypothetical protein